MTLLLYYSISSDLSEDDIMNIDLCVAKNRKFVTTLPSYSKHKAKRVFLCTTCIVLLQFGQPLLVPKADAIAMSSPPAIHRLSPIGQAKTLSNKNECLVAATIPQLKADKIKLTNEEEIKKFTYLAFQLNSGSITMEEAVLALRGGDGLTDLVPIIAFIIFMNYYDFLFGTEAFQAHPLPHQDLMGWLTGKHDRKPMQPSTSCKSPRFEHQMTGGVNDNVCPGLAMADENGFVMSYQQARNLVAKTYPGYLEVNKDCKITDWQAAKHIYHAKGMGVDPSDYGFTQQELLRIRGEAKYKGGGLIAYARRGYKLPPIEMIQDYQLKLKASCQKAPIKRTNVPYYDVNGSWEATVFATPRNEDSGSSAIIIAFNESTGDLITGDKQRPEAFNRFKNENYLGGQNWMSKWSNK